MSCFLDLIVAFGSIALSGVLLFAAVMVMLVCFSVIARFFDWLMERFG